VGVQLGGDARADEPDADRGGPGATQALTSRPAAPAAAPIGAPTAIDPGVRITAA
jgi:hypothetical protein